MEISFSTTKMARDCNSEKNSVVAFGPERGKKVGLRLDQMRAANTLYDFRLVHPRCHPLIGNRAGQWSADLDGPYRLIFEIAEDPIPVEENGSINLKEVRKVRILHVADTH